MDRGVKIAIFVASIVSLALGLVWDQVLNQARNAVQDERVDELAADVIQTVVGPPNVQRLQPPEGFEASPPSSQQQTSADSSESPPSPPAPPSPADDWVDYVLQPNDSANLLAYRRFADRGLTTKDIQDANPGCKWRVGDSVRIPPRKGAAPASTIVPPAPAAAAGIEPIEYVVQQGDSWWGIAFERFKDRFKQRGLGTDDLKAANPEIKTLQPGDKLKIP